MATGFTGEAVLLKRRGHLSVPDIARATGASEATVRGWLRERQTPSGIRAERLAELSSIVERLIRVMDPMHVPTWMRAPIPLLEGDSALDVIAGGDHRRLSRVVSGLEVSGAI